MINKTTLTLRRVLYTKCSECVFGNERDECVFYDFDSNEGLFACNDDGTYMMWVLDE